MKASDWTKSQPGYVGEDKDGFAIFDDSASGTAAVENLIFGDTVYSDLTIGEAINRYAPPTENNTGNYVDFVVDGVSDGDGSGAATAAGIITAAALANATSGGPGGGHDGSSTTYTPPAVTTPATSGGSGGGHDGSSTTYTPPSSGGDGSGGTPVGTSGGPSPHGGNDNDNGDPWDNIVKDTGYTDTGGNYIDDGWGENTGGVVRRRPGTDPALHRASGGMSSQQERYNDHPGEPMGTDTVPAWLTEGEFVIDKDSVEGVISPTDKNDLINTIETSDSLLPVVEWINDWEPTEGPAAMEAKQSDIINEQAMREKFNRGGIAEYRQLGGPIGSNYFSQQRQAAAQARNARQSGALQQSGLKAAGIAQQNQAGLIGQAGLQNRGFTPQAGALEAVGQGQGEAQKAEATYQDELGRIAEAERQSQTAGEEGDMSLTQKMIKVLEQANPHLASSRPTPTPNPNIGSVAPTQTPAPSFTPPGPHQNRGGRVVYRQEGGDVPTVTPTIPGANLDASISNTHPGIAKFVSAVTTGDPKQIVDTKQEYDILVPLEFLSLIHI